MHRAAVHADGEDGAAEEPDQFGERGAVEEIGDVCGVGDWRVGAAGDDVDVVVAEVSSFQLAFTTSVFAPDVAVLLNVAEDHLDWHGSVEAYAAAKAGLEALTLGFMRAFGPTVRVNTIRCDHRCIRPDTGWRSESTGRQVPGHRPE